MLAAHEVSRAHCRIAAVWERRSASPISNRPTAPSSMASGSPARSRCRWARWFRSGPFRLRWEQVEDVEGTMPGGGAPAVAGQAAGRPGAVGRAERNRKVREFTGRLISRNVPGRRWKTCGARYRRIGARYFHWRDIPPKRPISVACRMVRHISRNPSPTFPGRQPMPRRTSRPWRRRAIRQSLSTRMPSWERSEPHGDSLRTFLVGPGHADPSRRESVTLGDVARAFRVMAGEGRPATSFLCCTRRSRG